MSKKPFWIKTKKYKKGTNILAFSYNIAKFSSVKESLKRIKELKNFLYIEYPDAYEHDKYDWVIECDKYTQMILDTIENL